MPNLTLVRSHLFDAIGRSYTDVEFDELCFEFGVEVDDVSTEIVEVSFNDTLLNDFIIIIFLAITMSMTHTNSFMYYYFCNIYYSSLVMVVKKNK